MSCVMDHGCAVVIVSEGVHVGSYQKSMPDIDFLVICLKEANLSSCLLHKWCKSLLKLKQNVLEKDTPVFWKKLNSLRI